MQRRRTRVVLGLAVVMGAAVVFTPVAAADPYFDNVPGPLLYVEATAPIGAQATFLFPQAKSEIDGDTLLPVWCTHFSGEWYPIGTTPVVCYATDSAKVTKGVSFEVIVRDTKAPALTLPQDLTLEATGSTGAPATFSTSAYDTVDGGTTVSCSPASGSAFAVGTNTVTCSSTDTRGNKGTGTFKVTVRDTTAPTLGAAPAAQTLEATGPNGAVASYAAPTASDLVDGTVAVTCTPASGSSFALGETKVTCTATDAHANSATVDFTVTVQDTTAPVIKVLANRTVKATRPNGARVTYNATATDRVDGAVKPQCTPASGRLFRIGTTTVTCTATDASGNEATKRFKVTVKR